MTAGISLPQAVQFVVKMRVNKSRGSGQAQGNSASGSSRVHRGWCFGVAASRGSSTAASTANPCRASSTEGAAL